MTLTKMPQVGDIVRYIGKPDGELTVGTGYVIRHIDGDDDAVFTDDVGEDNYVMFENFNLFEFVGGEPAQPVGKIAVVDVKTVGKVREVGVESTHILTVHTDATGYATLQRLAAESDNQARRAVIERQIAELQRELAALV